MSDLSRLARKLKREERKRSAIALREYAEKQRLDRALFRKASPFVKRALREMANGCYGRFLWMLPLYGIRTISSQDNRHRGWYLFVWGRYRQPWERDPRHADLKVTLRNGGLSVETEQHKLIAVSDVSEHAFRESLKKALQRGDIQVS